MLSQLAQGGIKTTRRSKRETTDSSTAKAFAGTDHALAQFEGGQKRDVGLERLEPKEMRGLNDPEAMRARKTAIRMHHAQLMMARAEKGKGMGQRSKRTKR